jgi:hypothetical protein
MASADPLHTLERCAITPLVRRAMHSPTVEVSEWSVNPIHSGDGEGLGVYRFFGTGEDRGQPVGWSLILKAFGAPAEGGEEADWNYWKREAMAYRSGLLDDLPGGIWTKGFTPESNSCLVVPKKRCSRGGPRKQDIWCP